MLIKLSWYLSEAVRNRTSFLPISCILGHLVWLCLQEFLSLPVACLSPTSDELVFNTVVVESSLMYFLLIVSGKRVRELGKEDLILNFVLLGGISHIVYFPVAFEGPTLCVPVQAICLPGIP